MTIMRLWLIRGASRPVPTKRRVPAKSSWSSAASAAVALPEHSKTTENGRATGRPIGAGSSSSGDTTRAAPTAGARSRRRANGSDTVMSSTPRARNTAVVRSPTGPATVTRTASSGSTAESATQCSAIAVGSASAAARVERAAGTRSNRSAGTTTYCVNAPWNSSRSTGWRSRHTEGRPRRHARHRPQPRVGSKTTRAPISHVSTPSPSAATTPAHSCPRIDPRRAYPSSTRCRSVPQMPQCEISTSASCGPGRGTGRSRTASRPSPVSIAAGITCVTTARIVRRRRAAVPWARSAGYARTDRIDAAARGEPQRVVQLDRGLVRDRDVEERYVPTSLRAAGRGAHERGGEAATPERGVGADRAHLGVSVEAHAFSRHGNQGAVELDAQVRAELDRPGQEGPRPGAGHEVHHGRDVTIGERLDSGRYRPGRGDQLVEDHLHRVDPEQHFPSGRHLGGGAEEHRDVTGPDEGAQIVPGIGGGIVGERGERRDGGAVPAHQRPLLG